MYALSFEQVSEKHTLKLFSWLNSSQLKGLCHHEPLSYEKFRKKYLSTHGLAKHYIAHYKGVPFGLIQSCEVISSDQYAKYRKKSGSTVMIDFFIAEDPFPKTDYAFFTLKEFIPFLGKSTSRLLVNSSIKNEYRKTFENYGFTPVGQEESYQILAIDIRYTARSLLLNDKNELLLMRIEDDTTYDALRKDHHFWVTIGGTIENGETEEEAVTREIIEETGIKDFSIEKQAFEEEHTLLFSGFPVRHFEKYYFMRAHQFDTHQKNLTHNEKKIFRALHWWPLADLFTTTEVVYPKNLGTNMRKLLQGEKIPGKKTGSMQILLAKKQDIEQLNTLAFAAKASWGYPKHYLKSWEKEITVKPELIQNNRIFKAINARKELLGFYGLQGTFPKLILEGFWVHPQKMGQGIGKCLFKHMLETARSLKAKIVEWESDPNAYDFYIHMKAKKVGQRTYEFHGEKRVLPILSIKIEPS